MALSDDLSELQRQVHAIQMTLTESRTEAKTAIGTTRFWFAVFLPVITGLLVVAGGWVLIRALSGIDDVKSGVSDLRTLCASHTERLGALKEQRVLDLAHAHTTVESLKNDQKDVLERLTRRIDELARSRSFQVAYEFPSFREFVQANLASHSGTLASVEKERIVIEDGKDKKMFVYTKDSKCFIDDGLVGHRAIGNLRDLKGWVGQRATVWVSAKHKSDIAVMEVQNDDPPLRVVPPAPPKKG